MNNHSIQPSSTQRTNTISRWLCATLLAAAPLFTQADSPPPTTASTVPSAATTTPATATAAPATAAVTITAPSPSAAVAGPVDPEVQKALDYKMPENPCTPPIVRKANQNAGAVEKIQRAQKRYAECVTAYQRGLFADIQAMADAGTKHPVTAAQTEIIKRHMALVATTIKSFKGQ